MTKSGANTLHGDAFLFGQFGALQCASQAGRDAWEARLRLSGIGAGWLSEGRSSRTARSTTRRPNASRHADETASDIESHAAVRHQPALSAGLLPQVAHATADDWPVSDGTRGNGMVGEGHASTRRPWCRGWTDRRDAQPRGARRVQHRRPVDRSVRGTQTTHDVAVTGSWTMALSAHTTQ